MKMKVFILVSLVFLLASCKREREPQPVPEELTKLERLYRIRPDSVMKSYDLSNDGLAEFPNLSQYTIISLDLSHNQLDTIILEYLPKGVERLDLSYNKLKGHLIINKRSVPSLKELDVSHNRLNGVSAYHPLYRMNLSYNDLHYIVLNHENIRYLDVSYNPRLPERVQFYPSVIDTMISEGVAGGKRLLDAHDESITIP